MTIFVLGALAPLPGTRVNLALPWVTDGTAEYNTNLETTGST